MDSTKEGSRSEGIPSSEVHEFKVKVLEVRLKEVEAVSMFAKAGSIREALHYLLDWLEAKVADELVDAIQLVEDTHLEAIAYSKDHKEEVDYKALVASSNHEVTAFKDRSDSHSSPIEGVGPTHHSKEEAADMVAIADNLSSHHDAVVNSTNCNFNDDDSHLCRHPHGLLPFSILRLHD